VHTNEPVVERLIFWNCGTGESKRCRTCGELKPVDAFHRNARLPDGRAIYCKPCFRARQKAWRLANRQRYLSLATAPAVKTCRRCGTEQPVGNSYHRVGTRDGRSSLCRECLRADTLSWQLGNPEPHQAAVERWRAANRRLMSVARRVQSTVRRAIRSGELFRPSSCEHRGKPCKPDAAHID
jgi:hypothetical protein